MFTRSAPGFIRENSAPSTRPTVSGVRGRVTARASASATTSGSSERPTTCGSPPARRRTPTEEVFEDPWTFRIDRNPNPHLAFGIGEHFCLGSHVARLELKVAYKHLLPRIEEIELAGDVERLHSALVGGVKRLPIRYKLRAS